MSAPSFESTILARSGLVAFYEFNDTTTTFLDSFAGFNGTYIGGYTQGQAGSLANSGDTRTSVLFNGTSGYTNVADHSALDTAAFSVAGFVNLAALPASATSFAGKYVIGIGGWDLQINATGQLLGYAGVQGITATNAPQLTVGKWAHVAFTYANEVMSAYVNGVLGATVGSIPYTPETAAMQFGGGSTFAAYLNASLADFAIYNRALSAIEIEQDAAWLNLNYNFPEVFDTPVQFNQGFITNGNSASAVVNVDTDGEFNIRDASNSYSDVLTITAKGSNPAATASLAVIPSVPAPTVTAPSVGADWTIYFQPKYWQNLQGEVTITGLVYNSASVSAGDVIFTLPSGMIPAEEILVGSLSVIIDTSGNVKSNGTLGADTYCPLNVTFLAGA
jgi:hypothetical protein